MTGREPSPAASPSNPTLATSPSPAGTPTFSVITPVHDPPLDALEAMIESVCAQSWPHWELCLVDDASTDAGVWAVLQRAAASDPRIRVARRAENGGISRATNDALALATGEFVAFLDHDDMFVRDTLTRVAHALVEHAPVDFAYTDEAKLAPDGRRSPAFYKPDWSPERMRAQMYTGHLGVMRRSLVEEVGGLRPELDGSQDYDLVLRITERTDRIVHVPEMLYLWRALPSSAAGDAHAKPYAFEAGRRAVQEHCDRVGIDAVVEMLARPGRHRVRRRVRGEPLVSVIVPTRGSVARVGGVRRVLVEHALASAVERSTYPNVEYVVVADRETPPEVIATLEDVARDRLRVVPFDGPFNFSAKINAGVLEASGDMLLLLNDDVEVLTPDWIETLVALAQEPDCGLVGAKLLYADGTLQHGGHVYCGGRPLHIYQHYPADEPGMEDMLLIERECSGVTAACAAVRRDVFEEVGGFCEDLPVSFNDVDFSLKIRRLGRRVVWTPHAVLHHYESATRVREVAAQEVEVIRSRWEHALWADPYSNPNLRVDRNDWVPSRTADAWV